MLELGDGQVFAAARNGETKKKKSGKERCESESPNVLRVLLSAGCALRINYRLSGPQHPCISAAITLNLLFFFLSFSYANGKYARAEPLNKK